VFQVFWAIKFPGVIIVIGLEGKMTHVSCRMCNEVEKRKKLLDFTFDGLQKHARHWKTMFTQPRVVVTRYYISNTSQPVKNELHYVVFDGQTFVVQQVANGDPIGCKRKFVQLVTIFHLWRQGRPMTNFRGCKEFFDFINISNNLW
jgi:hypothetical protein